jgi:hypothetical protein
VLVPTKTKVPAEHEWRQGGRLNNDALDRVLNNAAGQRFHNHSPLDFEKLKGDPDHIFLRSISDDAGGTKCALTCEEVAALRMPLPHRPYIWCE